MSNSSFAYETEFKAYLDATFAINTENKEVIYFVMPLTSCTYCIQKSYEALTLMSPKDNMFIIIVGDFKNANVDQLAFTKLPFKKLHDVNEAAYRYGFGLAKPMVIHMRNNRCVLGQEISDDMIEEIPEIFQITPKKMIPI
ncbi:MAG TPA: hypothetical protein PKC76_18240 [Saprospiraceae bacterium]|nr:hypothetical protein [Saprospiraceae bacterium]HMP26074.1 hypothetical protein [Saprospiraceae bacterium]